MAAIAYPTTGGPTRRPPSSNSRTRAERVRQSHLRLVEAPLFVEPIFDELTSDALTDRRSFEGWSEPEVQLPRHQIVVDFTPGTALAPRCTPCYGQSFVRETPISYESTNPDYGDGLVCPSPVRSRAPKLSAQRYRIRRLVVSAAFAVVFCGALTGASALTTTHQGSPVAIAGSVRIQGGYEYTVHQGDTLWSIASSVYPDGDPRSLVAQLSAQLNGKPLEPGEHLRLP